MTATTDCTTAFVKSIAYDRLERNYRAELNGQIKGYYSSYFEAEQALDALVYELLAEQPAPAAEGDTPVVVASYDAEDEVGRFECGDVSLSLCDDGAAVLCTKGAMIDLGFAPEAISQVRQLGAIFHHPHVTGWLDHTRDGQPAAFPLPSAETVCERPPLSTVTARLTRALVRAGLSDDQQADILAHVADAQFLSHAAGWEQGRDNGFKAGVREMMGYAQKLRDELPIAPAVRFERYVSEPDSVGGGVLTGWSFLAGTGDDKAEFFFPDKRDAVNVPALYAMGREIDTAAFESAAPNIRALLSDTRVQEARRRWYAGLPIVPVKQAA